MQLSSARKRGSGGYKEEVMKSCDKKAAKLEMLRMALHIECCYSEHVALKAWSASRGAPGV